ncbi:hypothetical protein EXIGLDRAFT_764213 [Exidia glandulosa HHB12029]|uniref:CCHC-type domain-containing protein n=1 Tax=Exidia glandulosa HHB12029 TaxID=1314781 RepID=A0A165LD78_EXIGL|nr:hypothetical protein EXIGLDRAFT_764213 [Exidia glandulosa HHB12029]
MVIYTGVTRDHAVRSLSEAELKAVVDALLARSLPPGSSKPALLGVKKLANGNLRLRALSEDVKDSLVKEPGTWLAALAENAQLARDLYTVEVRAVPLAFRPSEAHAIQGLCQANAHVFPDASHVVTMRWLRDPRETHDKRTSSLLVVVDGNQAFCKAIYHGVAIHGRLCDVSPYVPSPTQCYFCQGWNHTVTACPRKKKNLTIICARCAGPHATSASSCPHSPACSSRHEVARSPKYARALSAYMSSLDRPWDAVASDARHSLPFSSLPRAGSAWRD